MQSELAKLKERHAKEQSKWPLKASEFLASLIAAKRETLQQK